MAPPTCVFSLPEHVWGLLYSLLDSPSRKAFRASSPAFKNAPSVLQQIRTLMVDKEQLHGVKQSSPHPLLCYPHGARLRTLKVHGSRGTELMCHFGTSTVKFQEDGPRIVQLFHPSDEHLRLRVAEALLQVEELVLKGCSLEARDVAATLGSSFCQLFPRLKTFRVEAAENNTWGYTMPDHAPLHEALLTALSGSSVREMDLLGIKTLTNEHHVAIGSLTSLHSLSIFLPEPEVPHLTFGALPNLRHLTVFSSLESGPYTRLNKEISKCRMLETLGKPTHLDKGMILSLPPTLKVLTVGKISFSDLLLLLDRAKTSLRELDLLNVDSLGIVDFHEGSGDKMGDRLSKRLAAVPHLQLEVTCLSHVPAGIHSFADVVGALHQVSGTSLTNSIKKLDMEGPPCMLSSHLLQMLATTCPNIEEIAAKAACLVAEGACDWIQRFPGLRLLSLDNDKRNSCDCLSDFLLPLCLAAQLDPHRTCMLTVAMKGGKESMFQDWENVEKMLKPIARPKVMLALNKEAELECNIDKFWDPDSPSQIVVESGDD